MQGRDTRVRDVVDDVAVYTSRDGLRPWQIGRVEARAKQGLRPADPLKGSDNVQRKRDEPLMVDVRQLAFRLHPDELIGIEFRRVARQAVGLHPGMAAEKSLDIPTPMDFPAVPQQNNLVSEMTEQLAEKRSRTSRRVLGGGRPQIAQTR
jgi:hypothetical protein